MKLLIPILFVSCVCIAADLTTKDGNTYADYTVIKVSARGVHITHADGMATIPFAKLPDDVCSKYAEQERKFAKEPASPPPVVRSPEEIALSNIEVTDGFRVFQIIDSTHVLATSGDVLLCLSDIDTSGLYDGILVPDNTPIRNHSFLNFNWNYRCKLCDLVSNTRGNKKAATKWLSAHANDKCPGKGCATIWRIGTYSYVSVNGSRKTIPKFTYSRKKALELVRSQIKQKDAPTSGDTQKQKDGAKDNTGH